MSLREYLVRKGVQVDGLCGSSFSQTAGSFSDVDYNLQSAPLSLYVHEQYGRFGNNVHQILHALIVARRLLIKNISFSFYLDESKTEWMIIDDILLIFGAQRPPIPPFISATMFQLQGFEKFIDDFNYDGVKLDAERLSRVLFKSDPVGESERNRKIVAFHFRSGDIFGTYISPIYTQPPLSYYLKSLDHIIETIKDFEIHVVYENDLNPCIEGFKAILADRGFPYQIHSSSFHEDARFVARADCIVASYSSFCDALALMSENLDRWYAFRSIAAYEGIDLSIAPDFSKILQSSGVEVYRVTDDKNSYTPLGGWTCSAEQIEQLLNYPIASLSMKKEWSLPKFPATKTEQ